MNTYTFRIQMFPSQIAHLNPLISFSIRFQLFHTLYLSLASDNNYNDDNDNDTSIITLTFGLCRLA